MFLTAILSSIVAMSWAGAQPQLAALESRVYITFADDRGISVVRSDDRGSTFGAPSRIVFDGKLSLGTRRGPRIVATPRAVVVAAIIGRKGGGADGDVVVYRSTDRGSRWSEPLVINGVPGSAREGLHAIAASPHGVLAVVWLDLRDTGTRVYAAISRDHGASWSADRLVYASPSGTVCECCHPSVAVDDKGGIAVLFRNSIDGYRDMYLVRSSISDRFGPATRLGTGAWKLDGCPMDGGDLELGVDGPISVWRREKDVYLTTGASAELHVALVGTRSSHATAPSSTSPGPRWARSSYVETVGRQRRWAPATSRPSSPSRIARWSHGRTRARSRFAWSAGECAPQTGTPT